MSRETDEVDERLLQNYTKKFQVHAIMPAQSANSQKRASCIKSPVGLLACCYQTNIRMHLHYLLLLDGMIKICSKLSTGLMQVACQYSLSTSVMQAVSTICSKSANISLHQS